MTSPALDAIGRRIAGPEPLLLIEAPAGYGKTHEAVLAAQRLAPTLPAGRKILFLTHTNAARETFNRRLKGGAAVMKTIHALACELVELYSAPLGLPRPLEPYRDKPRFDDMITFAVTLLQRRPELARGLAVRHPVILVDEIRIESGPARTDHLDRARRPDSLAVVRRRPTGNLRVRRNTRRLRRHDPGAPDGWSQYAVEMGRPAGDGRLRRASPPRARYRQADRPDGCPKLRQRPSLGRSRSRAEAGRACRAMPKGAAILPR